MMRRHLAAFTFTAMLTLGLAQAHAGLLDRPADTSQLCGTAVQAAETRYTLPTGLLYAISEVESGRPVPGGGGSRPWPWTVQAENQSHYFATKAEAIQWVRLAQDRGVASIDVGCMQVNLMYHPSAFATLDDAFDPTHNAEYAARFLTSLHTQTGDWHQAAGRYHSETLALALPYRRQVEAMLQAGGDPGVSPAVRRLQELQAAWGATIDTGTSNPAGGTLSGNWTELVAGTPVVSKTTRSRRPHDIMLSDAR
jgi:hypothetical protein